MLDKNGLPLRIGDQILVDNQACQFSHCKQETGWRILGWQEWHVVTEVVAQHVTGEVAMFPLLNVQRG